MEKAGKALKEQFIEFFKNPSMEKLPEFLKNGLGEFPYCDYKGEWPKVGDVARHILGMANTGGGIIVMGVSEKPDRTFDSVGLQGGFKDKADFANELDKYLPDSLKRIIQLADFDYTSSVNPAELAGKRFQIVFVENDPSHVPFMASRGTTDLSDNVVYVRRAGNTVPANYDELQEILNRRIDTNRSTKREMEIQDHLDQLKVLYDQIPRYTRKGGVFASLAYTIAGVASVNEGLYGVQHPNPSYPKEDYSAFVLRIIEKKKRRIELELDTESID